MLIFPKEDEGVIQPEPQPSSSSWGGGSRYEWLAGYFVVLSPGSLQMRGRNGGPGVTLSARALTPAAPGPALNSRGKRRRPARAFERRRCPWSRRRYGAENHPVPLVPRRLRTRYTRQTPAIVYTFFALTSNPRALGQGRESVIPPADDGAHCPSAAKGSPGKPVETTSVYYWRVAPHSAQSKSRLPRRGYLRH